MKKITKLGRFQRDILWSICNCLSEIFDEDFYYSTLREVCEDGTELFIVAIEIDIYDEALLFIFFKHNGIYYYSSNEILNEINMVFYEYNLKVDTCCEIERFK